MESIHYKILKILNKQPNHSMKYSDLHSHFSHIPDYDFREILSINMENNIAHSPIDSNGDFLVAITSTGGAKYHETRYSKFINLRTLWLNRIFSFIIGCISTLITTLLISLLPL